jgi:hypothetical protein
VEVLRTASGQLQVLVSSQGSDNIFVFTAGVGAASVNAAAVLQSVGGGGTAGLLVPTSVTVTSTFSATASTQLSTSLTAFQAILSQTRGLGTSTAASVGSASGTLGSTPTSATSSSTNGSSTGSATSTTLATADNDSILVAIQGNKYATVALLDFGSGQDDEPAPKRMPSLSTKLPIGDTNPLTRLVTGQDEALEQYRGSQEKRLREDGETPQNDAWREDLFHRVRPTRPVVPGGDADKPMGESDPEALLPHPDILPGERASEAVAGLLGALLLGPAPVGYYSGGEVVPTVSQRKRAKRPRWRSQLV